MFARIRAFFSEQKAPVTIFCVALAAHLAVFCALLYLYGPCSFFLSKDCALNGNDTQHYVILAENLTAGHGYSRFLDAPYEPDALRTPLLPLYFAPFTYMADYSLIWLAILLLNIPLALLAPLLYKLARLFLPHIYALVTGVVAALEPLYLYRSQIAEPDALLVLLIVASLYFLVRGWQREASRDWYIASVLLGFAILAKPTALYIAVLVVIFSIARVLFFGRETWQKRMREIGLGVCIIALIIAPWLIRNQIVFGVTAISSIQGYNLYQYYTAPFALPDEHVPVAIQEGSREPARYLPFQSYFTGVALERVFANPYAYAREQLVGGVRNLFVSDIAQVYYYGHTAILPFSYNPESKTNIHELLLRSDMVGFVRALFSMHVVPKVLWVLFLGPVYILALWGWAAAWYRSRVAFLVFTMFGCIFVYLVLASGPFVDAKYRLPGLLLILCMALYGLEYLQIRAGLHGASK
jgi:4-amino-4-deoxy-L-arabinose transferase-like glycosyltransferase